MHYSYAVNSPIRLAFCQIACKEDIVSACLAVNLPAATRQHTPDRAQLQTAQLEQGYIPGLREFDQAFTSPLLA